MEQSHWRCCWRVISSWVRHQRSIADMCTCMSGVECKQSCCQWSASVQLCSPGLVCVKVALLTLRRFTWFLGRLAKRRGKNNS